jgi:hypothetical protein
MTVDVERPGPRGLVTSKSPSTSVAFGPRRSRLRPTSAWAWLVTGSAAVLVATGVALGVLWISSLKTRTFSTELPGSVLGIELRLQSGNVDVVGGSQGRLSIRHSDRSAFGHGPREQVSKRRGIVTITSVCPDLVVGRCSSDYRIVVPDNVPISIRAENGTVHLAGYQGSADIATNSGAITVESYCGFVLGAASASGDIAVQATCSPERLALRSGSGDISAVVPTGSYRVQAASSSGATSVRGVTNDQGAPWAIEALSNTGSVRLAAGP